MITNRLNINYAKWKGFHSFQGDFTGPHGFSLKVDSQCFLKNMSPSDYSTGGPTGKV